MINKLQGYTGRIVVVQLMQKLWVASTLICVSLMLVGSIASSVGLERNVGSQTPASSALPLCYSSARSEFNKVSLEGAIQNAESSQAFKSKASGFDRTTYSSSFVITQ